MRGLIFEQGTEDRGLYFWMGTICRMQRGVWSMDLDLKYLICNVFFVIGDMYLRMNELTLR